MVRSADRARVVATRLMTPAAFVVVWCALVVPNRLDEITPAAFVQIPIEGLALVAVGLVLPARPRKIVAAAVGVGLGLLGVVKMLDLAFYAELDRPFNPVVDWSSLPPAVGVVQDSIGRGWADTVVVLAAVLVVIAVALISLSVIRLSRLTARHRRASVRAVGSLALAWIVCAALGVTVGADTPVAGHGATRLAAAEVRDVRTALQDQRSFTTSLTSPDSFRAAPAADLLPALRGKDVIFAFVESYGQVAVQDTAFSSGIDAVLRAGTTSLAAAGFSAQSAFLDSPTFGGISWLAHSTLQSGLWIDNQQRYDRLMTSDRFTLSDAFDRAGWRTVSEVPSNTTRWPEGTSFYHFDQLYDAHNVGYAGPQFSYATMPDQYTLTALQRLELQPDHPPVMAEVDLVSSHTPWTPTPRMVDWAAVGDGSIFDDMPARGPAPSAVWPDATKVRASYGRSVQYSLNALISWVTNLHDPDLVLIMLGDHQPATIVSGPGANHEVPISIIAHDPAVLRRVSSWGWPDGLLPDPRAPVWPMDAFRDRFLSAFGPQPIARSIPAARPGR